MAKTVVSKLGSFDNPIVLEKFEGFEKVKNGQFVKIKDAVQLFLNKENLPENEGVLPPEMYLTLCKGLRSIFHYSYTDFGGLNPVVTSVINSEREPKRYFAYENAINEAKQKNDN